MAALLGEALMTLPSALLLKGDSDLLTSPMHTTGLPAVVMRTTESLFQIVVDDPIMPKERSHNKALLSKVRPFSHSGPLPLPLTLCPLSPDSIWQYNPIVL